VATEQEFLLYSLSDHQTSLFQVHSSLHSEVSDSLFLVALSFSLKNWGFKSDSAVDWSNS